MKKLIILSLLFLVGCGSNYQATPIEKVQTKKEENKTPADQLDSLMKDLKHYRALASLMRGMQTGMQTIGRTILPLPTSHDGQ